jgi:hypothetical protein
MQSPEILPGLPGEGPLPEQFTLPGQRTHSEGFVLRFFPSSGKPWIGNFQGGSSQFSTVMNALDPGRVFVIAKGQLYVVDIETRALLHVGGWGIEFIVHVPATQSIVLGNGLWFESMGACEWKTGRLSWDGMKDIDITGTTLQGLGWTPLNDHKPWAEFQVNLLDGTTLGGSYDGPS